MILELMLAEAVGGGEGAVTGWAAVNGKVPGVEKHVLVSGKSVMYVDISPAGGGGGTWGRFFGKL